MSERGNTTHNPELDDQLAHEAQSIVQGHGSNAHVEEFRQSEPVPDDTDDAETVQASGYDGDLEGALVDDSTDVDAADDPDGVAAEQPDGSGDGADATVWSTSSAADPDASADVTSSNASAADGASDTADLPTTDEEA
ncbi:hypothetical protein DEJ34_02100 [Curtobacterium sp. MCPF17_050]|uniref:hypothetical protein n=1 Tax=Curtobacterium sp. MCPF17_050 TaxID=2175664 RepID=UPI000D86DAED|nr:hypothetical protein [Curtobacterium sp. MCPF17_050]WIB15945.1 hypothetical protein DEJ34_02100 [Curtobacterium sp. MCPF17_050]